MADSTGHLVPPAAAPQLNIPAGVASVKISCIDSTSFLELPMPTFLTPDIKGKTHLTCPAFSFLLEHGPSSTRLLFDLGVRKDPENLPPFIAGRIRDNGWTARVERDVATILTDHGVDVAGGAVDAVVWSHHHWDHIGDMGTFPKRTGLVVGPGFREAHLPGYPENAEAALYSEDFRGREVREVDVQKEGRGLKIGRFWAFDYFGDGSFYLLDTPGHAVGHVCGLVRTTATEEGRGDTFILLGGDACHHGAEFRPTQYLPLPEQVKPFPKMAGGVCPGEALRHVHRQKSATEPFYVPAEGFPSDYEKCTWTIEGLEEFDCQDNVLVLIAHDDTVMQDLVLFPKGTMNDWRERNTARKVRWRFLADFKDAVDVK